MSDPPSELSLTFACPQCRTPVRAGDILCPHCGVSLALAAVLAKRQVLAAMPAEAGAPYQADLILPRFGEYLVTQGHITGPGIPPERVAEIFQPFRQLDFSPGQLVDGTGLGLALVKRIVEAHASHIKVQTAPGHGSLFSFDLPIMQP